MDENELNISKSDQELFDEAMSNSKIILKPLYGESNEAGESEPDVTGESDDSQNAFSNLMDPALDADLKLYEEFAKSGAQVRIVLMNSISGNGISRKTPVAKMWKVLMVAAIFLLVAGAGLFWLLNNPEPNQNITVVKKSPDEILPGGKKAILIVDDTGKSLDLAIYADSSFQDNGIHLTNHEGKLVYQQETNARKVSYHTIVVPKGGEYQVMLEDGTKIWLNAASSLRYPTQFSEKERTVELTGEAYFEVVKNPQRPFKVLVDSMLVTVTGTEFNINAYHDEALLKSTLFNGKVKISKSAIVVDLVPGQQLQLDRRNNDVRIIESPDLQAVIAWKEGLFKLTSADIPTLMRQVARWYDIEIIYKNGIIPQGHISGIIPRNLNLSEILKVLEESGVKFEFDGKKLTVLP